MKVRTEQIAVLSSRCHAETVRAATNTQARANRMREACCLPVAHRQVSTSSGNAATAQTEKSRGQQDQWQYCQVTAHKLRTLSDQREDTLKAQVDESDAAMRTPARANELCIAVLIV